MSIMDYNGGAVCAMKGKDSVAICCDRRFGQQFQTISTNCSRVFKIHDKLYIGLGGLLTDVITVSNILKFRHSLYRLREERNMSPSTFTKVVSKLLYSRRFGPYFVDPVIVGIDEKEGPFVSSMDLIGATEISDNFACVGTTEEELYGTCEKLWRKDMNDKTLFENISQAMLSAMDRDCYSGWGCTVYVIDNKKTTISELKARQD